MNRAVCDVLEAVQQIGTTDEGGAGTRSRRFGHGPLAGGSRADLDRRRAGAEDPTVLPLPVQTTLLSLMAGSHSVRTSLLIL